MSGFVCLSFVVKHVVRSLVFVIVLAIGIGICSSGRKKVAVVSVATKCPTLCLRSRSRDVCFIREFAAFIREVRLLVQSPGDVPAPYVQGI